MEARVINLTPHPVKLKNGEFVAEIAASGKSLRVTYNIENVGELNGSPVRKLTANGLFLVDNSDPDVKEPLPEQTNDVVYIVSALAYMQAQALKRTDLVCPDTDQAQKNEKGHVLSVPGYAMY